MSVVDGKVQLPSEVPNPGQLVDYSEITREDATVVIRQRINISDPEDPKRHVRLEEAGAFVPSQELIARLISIEQSNSEKLDKLIIIMAKIANVNPDII